MSGILPTEREASGGDDGGVRVMSLDDPDAGELIGSLSSSTAREILSRLHDDPATASELSDSVDTSLQNVRHHLDSLSESDLVEVVDSRYSVKGREMNVYAPVEDALVVCVADERNASLLDSIRELLAAIGLLAAGSVLVQYAFATAVGGAGDPGTAPRVADSATVTEPVLGLLPPGVAFFAGGLLVLCALYAWSYRMQLRRTIAG